MPDDDCDEPLLGQWVEKLMSDMYDETQLYDILEHFIQDDPGQETPGA